MGTSNNPLDHPVLWSVQLKRAQEKRIADASLRDWQHRKQIERHARAKEQAHYREVMERYSPWGRKGGGAPNDTIRIRNIQLQGLYPESKNPSSTQISHAARRQDFRNPVPMNRTKGVSAGGGGAPLRNASGQIVTGLTDDPIISFNDANRYHVDNELRYRTTPAQKQTYKAELDRIVHEKENRRKTRSSDADAKTNGGPWGKPGPGGKPWRPPKNVGQNFMKSMGWTTKETLHDLDIDVVTRMQRQLEEENKYLKKFSNCCSRCVCQCVSNSLDPIQPGPGSAQNPRPVISPPKYFVSPPATAPSQPLREEPNPSTDKITDRRVPRLCQQNQQSTPGRAPIVKKGVRIAPTRNCMITGGVELVPLLAKRRSQQRPISLGTTDVTKIDKYSSNGSNLHRSGDEYLHDLCYQMNQKQRKLETSQRIDYESSKHHFDTWSTFWGRPGHGAPLPHKNKLNLDNLLYATPR
ncbi:uncharacterized protein LOC129762616 isoform X3 [Toxorhynchites rutilus septentrionalis]|uniref:uncharacterized protein LOC129762616 isoform X3 n=1 Tax=Toxorhynchites rutilus septentrionalis TaxID=329112 RepID=UPI002478E4EE|nr:uncharacterized protein LOC129762616 isoform X3 [Toxorhynchites rutilus septentrionalis]